MTLQNTGVFLLKKTLPQLPHLLPKKNSPYKKPIKKFAHACTKLPNRITLNTKFLAMGISFNSHYQLKVLFGFWGVDE
jgi:hypothetical protein